MPVLARQRVCDLDLVLQGGYPCEFVAPASPAAATPIVITTCPSGVWRVVMWATCYTTLATIVGAWCTLRVRRGGVDYTIAYSEYTRPAVAYIYSEVAQLHRPLILRPGDSLIGQDLNAAAAAVLIGFAGYVDVPIPEGEPTL